MLHTNKKGFLLIDSLITVFITSLVCALCYSSWQSIINYKQGYINYQNRSNNDLEYIYNDLWNCEACQIDEFD